MTAAQHSKCVGESGLSAVKRGRFGWRNFQGLVPLLDDQGCTAAISRLGHGVEIAQRLQKVRVQLYLYVQYISIHLHIYISIYL
jgi:hypothetical protein